MRPTARRAIATISVLAGLSAAPASAEWRRVDSPNFVVVGDVTSRDLRDIAIKFEAFRETLGRLLGERAIGTAHASLASSESAVPDTRRKGTRRWQDLQTYAPDQIAVSPTATGDGYGAPMPINRWFGSWWGAR